MTFIAEIEKCAMATETSFDDFNKHNNYKIFEFSKTKIKFTKNQKEDIYHLTLADHCKFGNETKYIFSKAYNDNGKKRFQVSISDNPKCKSFLTISHWNKFKCNIIHGRYWLYREREWFAKTIISVIIGAIVGYFAAKFGYKEGYKDEKASIEKDVNKPSP